MRVNIVDAGCGMGKTTALINMMNEDTSKQKYLFITPFLSEVERIKKACPTKNFIDPQQEEKISKIKNVIHLFQEGRNIVTTHALFKKFNIDIIKEIEKYNYILIMDEVADTIEELSISKSDLKILEEKYINIHPRTHMAEWKDDTYNGKLEGYMRLIKMNNIFAYTDNNNSVVSLLWMFPYQIFEAFKEIFVLTYMFDGQIQKIYFDYFNTKYANWYIKDFHLTPIVQKYDYNHTKKLIKVCHKDVLNKIGDKQTSLSKSWFQRNRRDDKIIKLQTDIYNFFRSHTKAQSNERLWTTFKEYKTITQRKGFVGGFAPINSRATNEYSNKRAVAYIGNRYLKPTIKNFFTFNNIAIPSNFEDKFALSELIQFVYRSAIRNNKTIDVYIPSKRMRNLFTEWLKKPND
jgi:SPBc2 prophage-derived uncharacterized protein yonV